MYLLLLITIIITFFTIIIIIIITSLVINSFQLCSLTFQYIMINKKKYIIQCMTDTVAV